MPIDALSVLYAQLTRHLLAIDKFLYSLVFTEPVSRRNTVGGTCAPPRAFLVHHNMIETNEQKEKNHVFIVRQHTDARY